MPVGPGVHRSFDVDIGEELFHGVFGKARFDRPRLDEADVYAGALQLHALRRGKAFKCEFRGVVGAAPAIGDDAEDRGAMDDTPGALPAHRGDRQARQFMPAEEIGFELRAQHVGRQVFDRTRLAVGAVVEQRIEPPAGPLHHLAECRANGCRVGVVEGQGFEAESGKRVDVGGFSCGCEYAPAVLLEPQGAMPPDAAGTAGNKNRSGHAVWTTPNSTQGRCQRDGKTCLCESRRR